MQRIIISKPVEGVINQFNSEYTLKDIFVYFEGKLPKNTKFYENSISKKNIIHIKNEKDISKILLPDILHIVIYPSQGVTDFLGKIFQVFDFFGTPETPNVSGSNTRTTSPNNQLSERRNEARPNARIPDIYGKVRSTPDLISQPYRIYEDHQEIEISYMCIGRGSYNITDVRDGDTLISSISGTSIEVYGANTSPNSGSPQLTIGEAITDPLVTTIRLNEVNGQVLYAPNQNVLTLSARAYDNTQDYGNPDTAFEYFLEHPSAGVWGSNFEAGQSVVVTGAVYDPPTAGTLDLNGTYSIKTITDFAMVLDQPELENYNWENIETEYSPAHNTEYLTITVSLDLQRNVGAFVLDHENIDYIYINVVARNGLYKKGSGSQIRVDVDIEIDLQPVDASFNNDGALEQYTATLLGSNTLRDQRALTVKITPSTSKRYKVTLRRTSDTDTTFNGTVADEVKVQDLYVVKNVSESDFGDVTTVYSRVLATEKATSVKDRKLNMLAERKIPTRISGDNFTTTLTGTSRSDEIICAIALDPLMGGLSVNDIDVSNIYDVVQDVEDYFGTSKSVEFNFTFDNDNLSFEEIINTICKAIQCNAYRQNGKIKISFEKETDVSVLLFNHRNKMPSSEQRNIIFGNQNDYDGIELTYIDSSTDAEDIFYIPTNKTAINPKKINGLGIRNKIQAYFWAWREYNKILHERVTVEFDALQEADLLVIRDRILVADNTRADVIDGEIRNVSGLTLTLSQPITFVVGKTYVIFLQLPSGNVESISISEGSTEYEVILDTAPSETLVFGLDKYAPTTYLIVRNDDVREKAFVVVERQISDNYISKIKCVNYSDLYYDNDKDFDNGIIDENGNII